MDERAGSPRSVMSSRINPEGGNGMYRKWKRMRQSLREVGAVYSLQAATKNIFPSWLLRWGSFLVVSNDISNRSGLNRSEEGIRRVKPEDADGLVATKGAPMTLEEYFKRGSWMCVYESDGKIAGFHVYDFGCVEHLDWLVFDLTEDILWGTDVWVAPELRGKELHARMRSFNLMRLEGSGYERTFGVIEAHNISSLRSSLKRNQVVATFTYFRLLNLTLLWVDGRFRIGFWRPGHRLVIHSDELRAVPGQKFGSYKVGKLERRIYKAGR